MAPIGSKCFFDRFEGKYPVRSGKVFFQLCYCPEFISAVSFNFFAKVIKHVVTAYPGNFLTGKLCTDIFTFGICVT